jgi:DNA-binding NarL/FixJ family response regulator
VIKRIMLVDDHSVVRTGIRQIFDECTDIVVDCEATSGQEALDILGKRPVDGVVLDLSMPDRSGIDVLKHMRAASPDMPVLILSMHSEQQYAMSMLRAGASGYITKDRSPTEILDAVRVVLQGRKFLSAAVAAQLAADATNGNAQKLPHEKLSTREFEVFCKLASGRSVSDIGTDLFLSVKTVSTHRTRIMEKMLLKTNADLIYYAMKNGLAE